VRALSSAGNGALRHPVSGLPATLTTWLQVMCLVPQNKSSIFALLLKRLAGCLLPHGLAGQDKLLEAITARRRAAC